MPSHRLPGLVAALLLACVALPAPAQGVLDRIKSGGRLVLAHRESSIPFSYLDAQGRPVGYAMDLCLRLAEVIRKKAGVRELGIDYLPVKASDRLAAIEQGRADLECGSTTNNAERREKVAFTVPHFIAGARLLVRANNPATRLEDLSGKTVVSTRGTTPLKVVDQLNRQHLMKLNLSEASDHQQALKQVLDGQAEAFVMDDVLLYGLIASSPSPADLKVVGRYLTTEPLAIMLPKGDTALKQVVDEEMKRLITSREIHPIYERWFMRPIPPANAALNLPMSYLLRDFWKYPTDQVPF
ncbi:amino acid ABC transporter substrate-binding protein [Curvibacter sp. HBC61]|uniref:Amino acid ABC transporter substrate-binding protein n=1 Tax=Curvibacter cyanobacteriorum TaxID=3026422 RepID=A0ABT5MZT4_9BURK|nr:amino acid ABC transporter substrate-binding protein [Curvibacter sp. HBC61]MDD0838776.1 amino acid ABC transporter substrate-binding protein [Curvibacter sp. HBC61]